MRIYCNYLSVLNEFVCVCYPQTANKHKEVLSVHEERLRALSLDLQRTHMDLTACRGEVAGLEAQLNEVTSGAAALKVCVGLCL